MYTAIRNTALVMVAFFSYITHASPNLPLIITRGAGGNASGAKVIRDNWRHGTPDLVNLSDTPIDKVRPEKYTCVLIIGQSTIKEMLLANNASAILSGKTVGLYTHLIDQNTLRLLRQLQNKVRFNFFFTHSQIALLKIRDISGYNFLNSKINNIWGQNSLAIETVAPGRINIPEKMHSLKTIDYVIWLGGNYTTSAGTQRIFTTDQIVVALKSLHNVISPNASIAIMLSPRFFDNSMNKEAKVKRLKAVLNTFSRNRITFYMSKGIFSNLKEFDLPVQLSPSYTELMRMPWSSATQHFASVDQYNLFADLIPEATPFLLEPNDADQALYATDYLNIRRVNLTKNILNHGCD
ncbi:TPA: hypothetical protein N2G33_002637 [Salmonella enterica]|nr:hypothetical protein [Salmonella enterica]